MSRWTKEEDEILIKNYGLAPVVEWINALPNRSIDAAMSRGARLGLRSHLAGNQFRTKPRFDPALPIVTDKNWEVLWEAASTFQEASSSLSTRREEQDVYLDVDHPIGVVCVADSHIGAIDTPLDYCKARIEKIAQYPFLYPADCGDKIDNYLPTSHASGMFGELFPPAMQKAVMENLYESLKGSWLWWIQGCHDDWSHQADDFDLTEWCAKQLGGVNLGFGGLVNLHVGEEVYKIAVRHKYRYNSSYNLTHTCKQLVRFEEKTADIAVVAHNHVTAVEYVTESDKPRVYIRPGSIKKPDRYARSLGFKNTGTDLATVILWPDKHQMMAFPDLDHAVDVFGNLGVLP